MYAFAKRCRMPIAVMASTMFLVSIHTTKAVASTGTITGKVVAFNDKTPLAYASVVVAGTTLGAMVLKDGKFAVVGVPLGKQLVRVHMMGYKTFQREVTVKAGQPVELTIELKESLIYIEGDFFTQGKRVGDPEVDPHASDTGREFGRDDFDQDAVEKIKDVVEKSPGVVQIDDREFSVKGGRSNEVKTLHYGIPVDDPFGRSSYDMALVGTQSVELITGGMDAEYGDAQSAIINLKTREGGDRFGGEFQYWTDDFGRADRTYTNYDRASLGFGGPIGNGKLRYFVSGQATFTDGETPNVEPREEHKITEWLKFRDRQSESYNVQGKLTWSRGTIKLSAEAVGSHSRQEQYRHNWNLQGYVGKIHYFQQLVEIRDGIYTFGSVTVVPHGSWATESSRLELQPVVVEQVVRDPHTGVQSTVVHEGFRAARIGGRLVAYDQVMADGSVKSWSLFSGFQSPYSEFDAQQRDSSFVGFNSAGRTPETVNNQLHLHLGLDHVLSERLSYQLRVARLQYENSQRVNDQDPWEYDTAGHPVALPNGTYLEGGVTAAEWYTDPSHPYFATAYDFPWYSQQTAVRYIASAAVNARHIKSHRFKFGGQLIYNDLNSDERQNPGLRRFNSQLGRDQWGTNVNIYHAYNLEGNLYAMDRWFYESLVANAGMRVDFFSTGNAPDITLNADGVDRYLVEYKAVWSPRIGISFPISDRDKFFFHYARNTQWADRSLLFGSQNLIGNTGVLGNPNLEEQLTVSYVAGIGRQFSDDVAGHFALFNNDIYGLVAVAPVTDDSTGLQGYRWVNRSYGSSRGLELLLEKRLSNHVGFDLAYTYSFADGVSSDASFGVSADGLTHLPTEELPLDWDQRHTVSTTLRLAGSDWLTSVSYQYGSGLPWTPVDRLARKADPSWENSRRLEPTHRLNLRAQKQLAAFKGLTVFVEGRNLLDQDILRRSGTSPLVSPGMTYAQMDGGAYLTETGNYGGAYLADTDDDGTDNFVPVHDPSVWQPHRTWRMGLGYRF